MAAATGVALVVTAGLAAPAPAAPPGGGLPGAERPGAERLDGVWRVDGYGTVLAIADRKVTAYDVTSVSCTDSGSPLRQVGEAGPGGATRYGAPENAFAELTVTPQGRHRAVYQEDGAAGSRTLERLPGLPALCGPSAPDDAVAVFDRFWANFEENYPFFAAKGVDWHALRDTYRPQVTSRTTDQELQEIFVRMLTPLHDAHVVLARPDAEGDLAPVFSSVRPGTVRPSPDLMVRAAKPVAAQLTGPERAFGNGLIGVGELPDGIGYLRVSTFSGYVKGGSHQDQEAELDRALDALLADPARLRGLVIDVRVNGGGSDALGLRIAARLTDRPYVAYRKVARNDPGDPTRYTRPQALRVRPADGKRFTGPVALLTSGSTVSAGETFTQALMGRGPHVTRIGESTQGVFSDVMTRKLSCQFTVTLPNEKFLTPQGTSFDGPGIPAELSTPVFTPEELDGLKDSALTRARRLLGGS
ncbi:S41 family peptidase [Kitasatospora sp. NPDC004240]